MINDEFKPKKICENKKKKFKGHVKLTLKDAKTGEVQQVVEGDNIVTNALDDIFNSHNYFGCLNYNALTPIYTKWFGGVLLYENEFPVDEFGNPDANDYFIKKDSYNHLVGHAGPNFNTDTRDDPSRGSPNTYLRKFTPDSVTMAWEFGPTQSNGQISSVCLTHADVGDAGTGKDSNAFKALNPFAYVSYPNLSAANVDSVGRTTIQDRCRGQLDERHKFFAKLGEEDNYGFDYGPDPNGGTSYVNTSIREMPFDVYTLDETQHGRDPDRDIKSYNEGFKWWRNPGYSWDEKNKTLWMFSNTYVVRRQTQAVSYEFASSRDWVQVAKFQYHKHDNIGWLCTITYDIIWPNAKDVGTINSGSMILHQQKEINGVYQDIFYFPYWNTTTGRDDPSKMIRFNYQNQEDVTYINVPVSSPDLKMCGPRDGDLLVGNRGIVNDQTCYRVNTSFGDYSNYFSNPALNTNAVLSLANGKRNYDDSTRWIVVNKMVHTTIFNLPSSIMKTASQTMEVEYTITEVEDDG